MNPSSSSSSKPHKKKCSHPQAPYKMERKQKEKQIPRNPLQDLNVTNSSNNTSSSTVSTSISIEAPKGCLRFFLSHSSSTKTPSNRPVKSLSKTPKSAPTVPASKPTSKSKPIISKEKSSKRTISEKSISQKPQKSKENPPCLYQWQSGKKTSSKGAPKSNNYSVLPSSGSPVSKLPSGCGEVEQEQHCVVRMVDDSDTNLTPLSKLTTGSGLDSRVIDKVMDDVRSNTSSNKTKTPPVQASVSPEIHCGSFLLSTTTPACYAAGYVVSGVTDKRKCRPRGILTVGDNDLRFGIPKALNNFDDNDDEEEIVVNNSSVSMVPLPAEASMHWLLSPCNEEDDHDKENSDDGSCQFVRLDGCKAPQSHSPLSDRAFSSDICNISNNSIAINSSGRKRRSTLLLSPSEIYEFQGFVGPVYDDSIVSSSPHATTAPLKELKEDRKYRYNIDRENSPFSMDTLGSENVIQTPQSESSSERNVGMSWLNAEDHHKHHFDPELNSGAMKLQMASLSPKSHVSMLDPTSSSFQFDCLTTPSNSIDISQFQKILGDRDSWVSNSIPDTVSQSQMRISWREGLVSRIFEMDEFDSCRFLSDEEEDVNDWSNDWLKSHQSPEISVDGTNDQILMSVSTEFEDKESATEGKDKERLPPLIPCTCAESISTDGGGLVRSEDSDWTLCYKNHLFEV